MACINPSFPISFLFSSSTLEGVVAISIIPEKTCLGFSPICDRYALSHPQVPSVMFSDDSSKISRIEIATNVLSQALEKLHEHDYVSAQVMVAVASQVLEELQLDFDHHFQIEARLKQLLKSSCQ